MSVLVVGATRILRPVAIALAAAGDDVLGVARTRRDLDALAAEYPGITGVPVDWSDRDRLAAALAGRRIRRAVLYCPGAPDATLRLIARTVTGAVVHVLPSAAATPGAAPVATRPRWRHLQLGWTGDPPRWHTPEEISAAALDVLRTGVDNPWTWAQWLNTPLTDDDGVEQPANIERLREGQLADVLLEAEHDAAAWRG